MTAMPTLPQKTTRGTFVTNDGCTLSYVEAGVGKTVLMIPGWSQTAAGFAGQMALADSYHLIALDMRGHGESSKPNHGFRVHRLAKDVHEFMTARRLTDVTLLGHSMGCSVIWAYWDLYRREGISRIVMVDQVPVCTNNPVWADAEKDQAGGVFDPTGLYDAANGIAGPDGIRISEGFVGSMFTAAMPAEAVRLAVAEALKLPREPAARLLINHCMTDWRDVFATIDVPSLLIAGEASFFKVSALRWIHAQMPCSRLEVFGADEGGSHFMFMENPVKFNAVLRKFLQ